MYLSCELRCYTVNHSLVVRLIVCVYVCFFFVFCFLFLMIRRPPRSTLDRSSAASDVYKRQRQECLLVEKLNFAYWRHGTILDKLKQ